MNSFPTLDKIDFAADLISQMVVCITLLELPACNIGPLLPACIVLLLGWVVFRAVVCARSKQQHQQNLVIKKKKTEKKTTEVFMNSFRETGVALPR